MCVICAKPKGVKMPDEDTLSTMWMNNPDGAGIMYARGGEVHIQKGYMTYDAFSSALNDLRKKIDLDATSVVLHFRITTHGGTKPENCHPFPISNSVGMLQKRKVRTQLGVAHNGIIDITPRKGISDTMEYIISQLSYLQKAVPDFYKNKDLMEMISNATGSKLAFMNGKGGIYTIGKFEEEGGIKYSNSSYKSWRWSKSSCYDYYDEGTWHWASETTQKTSMYSERALMWLDTAKGEYVVDNRGMICDGDDFAIDVYQKVYTYSELYAAMVECKGFRAKNAQGGYLSYNMRGNVTVEPIFYRIDTKGTSWK